MHHGREWPLSLPSTHASRTVTERGGATAPGWGPQNPGWGPKNPYAVTPTWRVVGLAGERSHLTRNPVPPPVPHPGWGGAARTCGPSPRRPCYVIQAVRAARSAEGPRTAPSAPPHTSWR